MNIICCIKQVPDTADIKIDPGTNTLIRSGVESIINPFDLVALEAALALKDMYGGTVAVISMGP
ncbi:MAG: electron transfer flavoprotein subunit beta, partial [Syntrophorhabdaceae bacterium]